MSVETLRIVRNALLRSFAIGVLIALVMAAVTWLSWDFWVNLFTARWHLAEPNTVALVTLCWFGLIRLVLVFGMLVPALGIHWTLVRERRGSARQ